MTSYKQMQNILCVVTVTVPMMNGYSYSTLKAAFEKATFKVHFDKN